MSAILVTPLCPSTSCEWLHSLPFRSSALAITDLFMKLLLARVGGVKGVRRLGRLEVLLIGPEARCRRLLDATGLELLLRVGI